jgi:hypothetical protein
VTVGDRRDETAVGTREIVGVEVERDGLIRALCVLRRWFSHPRIPF